MTATSGRVVVVGAGISGLACAHRLQERRPDLEVVVLEAGGRTGGKIHTTPFAGRLVDEAADAFLARVPAAVALARELGLEPQFVTPAVRRAFVYRHRTLHPFPEGQVLGVPLDLERLRASGVISPAGVDRAALDLTLPGGLPGEPAAGEDESVGSLVRRRVGDEVFEALVSPLLSGVNAGDADQLSLQAGAPQFAAAVRDQPSLIAGLRAQREAAAAAGADPDAPIFYGLHDGTQGLTDALVDALPAGAVRTGVTVHAVMPSDGGGFNLVTSRDHDHVPLHADAVVLATPAWATASVLQAIQPDIAAELAAVEWSSVVMVTLAVPRAAIDHPLDGSGFLVADGEELTMSACSFSSTKWAHLGPVAGAEPASPADTVLLRVSAGRHPDASALDRSDTDLVAAIHRELGDVIGLAAWLAFDPQTARVTRWRNALPQYRPGHQARARAWRDGLAAVWPGLWLTGASYDGLGIPACITDAERIALEVADTLG
jgi:oxygen-dependent protoporphyrinogen oxidase